jgi:hypothetical protein
MSISARFSSRYGGFSAAFMLLVALLTLSTAVGVIAQDGGGAPAAAPGASAPAADPVPAAVAAPRSLLAYMLEACGWFWSLGSQRCAAAHGVR